jgi:metal-responsive CopG/Arc/MetJ family transcriptional regulator
MNNSDRIVYMRVPQPILEVVDTTVAIGLYANRAEVLRELLRNGMKSLLYHERGGFCQDLKNMVDCCHDEQCKFHENCKIYSE